jgi:hypothetical protein
MDNKTKQVRKAKLKISAKDASSEYIFDVGIYVFKEDGVYISYSPAFDLCSYAEDFNGAIAAFYEAFQLYVEYCIENNTLEDDLKEHGWKIVGKKIKEPGISRLLKNETMNKILTSGINYQRLTSSVSIPAFA